MARKILLEKKKEKYYQKPILILEQPERLLPALNPISLKILSALAIAPSYPLQLAKKLNLDRQLVYYHLRALERAKLVEVVKKEAKKGAICKYWAPSATAFGIELPTSYEEIKLISEESYVQLRDFFYEFIKEGIFSGSIVVGSPTPHGPFLTSARDGHYGIQLAMFLGSLCELPRGFVVKLDTEIKAEHEEKRNMILIGGPITNIISAEINDNLRIRFKWAEGWKIFSQLSGIEYVDEDLGIIAKIKNPWEDTKVIILFAGLKFEATKSCIVAITQHYDKLLNGYSRGKDFFSLIRGLDRDGDGKVDDIEIVERS